ncbi:radical SAM protein [Candidatus Woesearchaeota archaeon]|nr:radical SAM protein [Candidatus Woesearchaeota archaeon]
MIPCNKFHSYNAGVLPEGCQYCVRGEKLVLFVTGLCPRTCYFCPLSDSKYMHDVSFANERRVQSDADVIAEAECMDAKGAGITGGDPLAKLERTASYIQTLKKRFGKSFHIHLYTSLDLVSERSMKRLFDAGLDEIRFHLDLDNKKFWKNIEHAAKFPWVMGVEIPLIPTKKKETEELIDYVQDKISFLNLNELEVADNAHSQLIGMGFRVRNKLSYAVKGSREMGLRLMKLCKAKKYEMTVHLCTARLKDAIQLTNRIRREGKKTHLPFDEVDDEGLLTRGALYLPELAPGFGYRKKLEEMDTEKMIGKLKPLFLRVKKELMLKEQDIFLDEKKPRILLSQKQARKNSRFFKTLGLLPAVVLEYPTADQLEMDVGFVR